MLEDYAKHLAARHLTPQTVNNTLRQLRAIMQWRNDDDWRSVTLDDLTGWHEVSRREVLGVVFKHGRILWRRFRVGECGRGPFSTQRGRRAGSVAWW